jgi:hypothetical protein
MSVAPLHPGAYRPFGPAGRSPTEDGRFAGEAARFEQEGDENVHYLEFLDGLHNVVRPSTYLEIGIRNGDSLARSRARSIGIDPAFSIRTELDLSVALFRTTSDEYFQRPDPLRPFDGAPVDMAFIDGLHLAEYAFRDFVNVERHSAWTGVVVFDDMFPRRPEEAARRRFTQAWTGDVYKVHAVLRSSRPDLVLLPVGTQPTGLLLVLALDPARPMDEDSFNAVQAGFVAPDPQDVPADVLSRVGVLAPDALLESPLWTVLADLKQRSVPRSEGLPVLTAAAEAALGALPHVGPPAVPQLRRLPEQPSKPSTAPPSAGAARAWPGARRVTRGVLRRGRALARRLSRAT